MDLITDRISNFMRLHEPAQHPVAEQKESQPVTSPSNPNPSGFLPDIVEISEESQSRAASDNDEKSLWQDLHKLATNKQDKPQGSEDDAKKGPLDVAIKKLQEQIRELQERMDLLAGKEDEASQEQLEQLEAEMISLNVQLMELNNKKLEQLKTDKV